MYRMAAQCVTLPKGSLTSSTASPTSTSSSPKESKLAWEAAGARGDARGDGCARGDARGDGCARGDARGEARGDVRRRCSTRPAASVARDCGSS